MKFKFTLLLAFLSLNLHADDDVVINVEASKLEKPASAFDYVIEKEEIDKTHSRNLGELLRTSPGFQISSNYLGISTATLRGLGAGNILVYWNGIKLNDPLDPTSSFDFSRLELDGASKVEIIRGPEAALWGSGATGAVIFITADADLRKKGTSATLEAKAGSYKTIGGAGEIQNTSDKSQILLFSKVNTTEGISAANSKYGNFEKDGRQHQSAYGFASYKLSDNFKLVGASTVNHTRSDTDMRGGPGGDDFTAKDSLTAWSATLQGVYTPKTEVINKSTVSVSKDIRYHKNLIEYARYQSLSLQLQNEHRWQFAKNHALSSAVDFELESGKSIETYGLFSAKRQNLGAKLIYDTNLHPYFFRAGVRAQKDLRSSAQVNPAFFLSPSYELISTSTLFGLSAGYAYKKPSLYQLFSSFGNSTLQAERLWSYELNILQDLKPVASFVHLSWFWNHTFSGIDYNYTTQKYFNHGQKENYGIESDLETDWTPFLKSRAEYTWTHTSTLRVAEHKASLKVETRFGKYISLIPELLYIGKRSDIDAISFRKKEMPDYTLLNASLNYFPSRNLTIALRSDNILDKDYEEIDGYGTPGRYFELSAKITF
jgi:vitamin B12 transporter